jgi:predicted nucleic acid-binding Zn ribbon protein
MKLFVCESCEAEFSVYHNMDDKYYKETYCPFCGEGLDEELEDEIEWEDEDE